MEYAQNSDQFFEKLYDLLNDFLATNNKNQGVVPIDLLCLYVKDHIECSDISDGALSNIIANHVILEGFNVEFRVGHNISDRDKHVT